MAPRRGWALGLGAATIAALAVILLGALCSWSAAVWSAMAAWATVGLALVAGVIALRQLAEARALRIEQAQPYVVVLMELSRPNAKAIDLVVKNLGRTAALEVRLEVDPIPVRAAGGQETDVWLPPELPVLVPGQAWRTFWDMTTARTTPELQRRHTAAVTYKDGHGAVFRFDYVLDWTSLLQRASLVTHDFHKGVETLIQIEKALERLAKP